VARIFRQGSETGKLNRAVREIEPEDGKVIRHFASSDAESIVSKIGNYSKSKGRRLTWCALVYQAESFGAKDLELATSPAPSSLTDKTAE
jgi:hypothetical protein